MASWHNQHEARPDIDFYLRIYAIRSQMGAEQVESKSRQLFHVEFKSWDHMAINYSKLAINLTLGEDKLNAIRGGVRKING